MAFPGKIKRFRTKQVVLSAVFWALIQESIIDATSGETNLALAKPTNQSSTDGTHRQSSKAVDGNVNGDPNSGSCSSTETSAAIHWWMVDLEDSFTIRSVRITNQNDCCQGRLAGFTIEVSEVHPNNLTGFPGNTSAALCKTVSYRVPVLPRFPYACDVPVTGRYVRVIKPSAEYSPLTLCEFEVYEENVYVTPAPPGGSNLALMKPAYQSTTANSIGYASKAVDGSLDGNWGAQSCIHTQEDSLHWWMVDLEDEYVIDTIGIVNRHDCCDENLKEFVVEISQEHPSNISGFPERTNASACVTVNDPVPIPYIVYYDCEQPLIGRYVRVVKNGKPLNICEIQVFGVEPPTEPPVIAMPKNGEHGQWTFSYFKRRQDVRQMADALQALRSMVNCARRRVLDEKSRAGSPFIQIDFLTGQCLFLTNVTEDYDRPGSDWIVYKLPNL